MEDCKVDFRLSIIS